MAQVFNADRLAVHLQQAGDQLAPLYTLTSDEPLMLMEAGDALRASARSKGYTQRTTLVMEARSDWSSVITAAQSVSLFDKRRLLELKIPTGKPGKVGADTLIRLTQQLTRHQASAETVVVIHLPRLDKATRQSRWALALATGMMVELPTLTRTHLPAWIGARLAQQNQHAEASTLQWLADKVEGNLLAAHQEIQKLALLYPSGPLAPDAVKQAVLNVARYSIFDLRDAMLAGAITRTVGILEGLKAEGEALPLVLWAVGEEIRLLACVAQASRASQASTALLRSHRIFGAHEPLARQALARVPAHAWPAAVQHAHDIDRLIKGLSVPGRLSDPWAEMTRLALRVAAA